MWKRKPNDRSNYDHLIKTALTGHLGEATREVQRQQAAAPYQADAAVESSSEAAHTLCCVVEALFIHRLRDSFVDKVSNVFSGDVVRQPAPNFWPFLQAFSHRHSIDFLSENCSYLRADIGRCRGWIRLILNEGMLSSYLELLATEKRLLGNFYEKEAFLRDPENVDIARKMLGGIEVLQFRLAVNSSMLNIWSTTPLLLAGLWTPTTAVVHEAVVQGVDAVQCFTDEDETLQAAKPVRTAASPSKLDEDLAFRLILESERSIPSTFFSSLNSSLVTDSAGESSVRDEFSFREEPLSSSPSGSFSSKPELSFSEPEEVLVTHLRPKNSRAPSPFQAEVVTPIAQISPQEVVAALVKEPVKEPLMDLETAATERDETEIRDDVQEEARSSCRSEARETFATFEDLLDNYTPMNASGLLPKSVETSPTHSFAKITSPDEEPEFELISGEEVTKSPFEKLLPTLNNEKSLVSQNYQCAGCSRSIGILYGPARVCSFTGGSYCPDCHVDDEAVIPARVFLNGDWSKRRICIAVKEYFDDVYKEPLLNAAQINRNVYSFQPEFGALFVWRSQLVHLSAYLLSCRTGVGEELRKKLWSREHFYEDQHKFALADLPLVQSGQLGQLLTQLVQAGKQHVAGCEFCSLKGFICEACHSDSVLFPFDVDSVYRCPTCGAVFHQKCMDRFKPCPRCQRWTKAQQNEEL